jgi:hypothetical protein
LLVNAAVAIVVVFVAVLFITDLIVQRRRNRRAIETMRRNRGGLGL